MAATTSRITVTWTPETSGRVTAVQIESRIAGKTGWTEQAANAAPAAGTFTFTADAPDTDVEVRLRHRMASGVFSPWQQTDVRTASTPIPYSDLTGRPTSLGQINGGEGSKLSGIEPGATAGAPAGTTIAGVPASSVTAALKDKDGILSSISAVQAQIKASDDAQAPLIAAAKKAGDDANAKIDSADSDLNKAIAAAKKAGTDADAKAVNAQSRATDLETTINTPTSGLSARLATVETSLTNGDSNQALTQRTTTLEAAYSGVAKVVTNEFFDNDSVGWDNIPAGHVVASSGNRRNVLRTPPSAKYNGIQGRIVSITSDDQRFKLRASWRCAAATGVYYFGVVFYGADGATVAATDGTGNYPLGPNVTLDSAIHGWIDREAVIGKNVTGSANGGTLQIPAAAVSMRPVMFINYTDVPGSVTEVDYFTIEDVTSVERSNARIAVVETAYSDPTTGLARRTSDLETSVNTPTTGISARLSSAENVLSNPTTGLVKKTESLEVNYRPTGNLVPNSALITLDGWYFNDQAGGGTMSLNRAGVGYMIGGIEHNLTLHNHLDKGDGLYSEAYSPMFAVTPGKTIQAYCYAMSHRAQHWVSVMWLNGDGTPTPGYYAGEYLGSRKNEGGQNINAWEITGFKAVTVPADAVAARMFCRQYGSTRETDRYSWFTRPFVSEVAPGCTTWMTYSPGDNRAITTASNAKLNTAVSVLGDANGGIVKRTSDLETSTSSLGSRVGAVELATTDGRFATASRAASLEARAGALEGRVGNYNSADLSARISTVETATTDGRFATTSRMNDTVASVNGLAGRISTVETATTDGRFATASRAEQIAAEVYTGPNRNALLTSRISTVETATTDGRFAATSTLSQLRSEYNGTAATVTTQAGTIADVNNRTRAYWSTEAVAGGRAQLAIYSDSNGGGGVDIVGDVTISGNLLVSGTVTSNKVTPSAISQSTFQTLNTSVYIPYG